MTTKTQAAELQRPVRQRYDWSSPIYRECGYCGYSHTATVLDEDSTPICATCADDHYWSEWQSLAETALSKLEAAETALAELKGDAVPVFGWMRVVSGSSFQIMEGEQRPPDRSGNGAGPWFAVYRQPASPPVVVLPIRTEHAAWSQVTFGDVGPVGPLKHLAKEAIEAAEAPDDLSEWADMQFLLWDAQRRAGITDAQIEQAMIEKLAINKARTWPAPKDGEPRLHVKSADAEGE